MIHCETDEWSPDYLIRLGMSKEAWWKVKEHLRKARLIEPEALLTLCFMLFVEKCPLRGGHSYRMVKYGLKN